ncbi:MAG: M1 family aminopeptidase [Microthrixaceae bacterium]|nr:M1 family aminopeptidase [Microthrixaceae bacterium]
MADVINHELAHMWFGNLVTMSWWNGIWLNEAFATFMEISASDAFRPEWDVWTAFGLARAGAFDTDALASTRPIEYEVVTAADSEAMFDILTYEKGASVIRMLEQYLGTEEFRDGIRAYLRRHAHANTETTDLWDALEEATGQPVRRIAETWIHRGGHPLVSVSSGPDPTTLLIDQQRAPLPALPTGKAPAPFPIPMRILTRSASGEERAHRFVLEGPTEIPSLNHRNS